MSSARLVLVGAVAAALVAMSACSPPDRGELERKTTTRATVASFTAAPGGVSTVIERRCGSLDCHGDPARNLRVYSARGLRLPNDAGLVPGSGDTTRDEMIATYESLLTLEPEQTNKVLDGVEDASTLLIVKKPLEIEKHKGGPVMKRNDDAERCIVSWLRESPTSPVDKDACTRAAVFPKE